MNRVTLVLATSIILLLFFTGCDKYHTNRYIGDWDFVTIKHDTIKSDTIYYSGKISLGNYENALIIQYTKDDEIAATLIENRDIVIPKYNCAKGVCTHGKFEEKNKMNLSFGWTYGGGKSWSHNIVGTKKKKGGKK